MRFSGNEMVRPYLGMHLPPLSTNIDYYRPLSTGIDYYRLLSTVIDCYRLISTILSTADRLVSTSVV